ncbi:hypothetical protein [Aureivirga sp. CE67]|uniref:hypothetical protein n=1 Tax=Aureivirga sp. CE67 TaxID=1788983 RepID=UPI0018CA9FA4|nr:hypothetical protein [Aureivirga sp. CE67]
MSLKKIYLIFFLSYSIFSFAQPEMTPIVADVDIEFLDSRRKVLNFHTNDSLHFQSGKYGVEFYSVYTIIKNDIEQIRLKEAFYKMFETHLYYGAIGKVCMEFKFSTKMFDKYNGINENIAKIVFKKKNKTMTVYLNFKKYSKNFKVEDLKIRFKKGTFVIEDFETYKLLSKKDSYNIYDEENFDR